MDVSIIIPTLNRADFLQLTLQSILLQKAVNLSYEVIVIDNGSSDGTRAICEAYTTQFQHFSYCYDDVPGQLTGRHRGLQMSQGKMLCYLDDDVELNDGWLNAIHQLSQKYPDVAIFGGPSLPKYATKPPHWLNRFWEPTPYGGSMCLPLSCINLDAEELDIDPLYVFGLNLSIRKHVLLQLKGFHPDCIPSHFQRYQGDGETGLAIKAGMHKVKALHSAQLTLQHQIPAERMTEEYFKKWSFYNGVCQSFTDLRYTNALYTRVPQKEKRSTVLAKVISFGKRISGAVSRRAKGGEPSGKLSKSIHETYQRGYAFHQNAFQSDPKVKNWVLKADYFDYAIPN